MCAAVPKLSGFTGVVTTLFNFPLNSLQDLRASEVELEVSEYSPEDDSSSAGGDQADAPSPPARRESEAIIAAGLYLNIYLEFWNQWMIHSKHMFGTPT